MPTLHLGQGTHLGGLSVFPIWTDAPIVSGLATGRAARVRVAEREGSPVVGELVLKNEGAKTALLVAGELFEGGWQHRALNHDILLVPGQQLVASVSCVEHGRWHGATAQVRRSRRASMMVRSAQTIADDDDRQNSVWDRVSRYDNAFGASPTASYVDHLNRRAEPEVRADGLEDEVESGEVAVAAELAARIKNIRALPGQRGVLIGLGGQPAFLELFASPTGLRRHLPGLLEAAAIDAALLDPEPTPGRRARRFAGLLADAPIGDELGTDAGAGHALASRSKYHEIRGLGWNDQLLHATVFNRRHHLMEVA
ncbi:MAG TPA: DUF6569 family protein [Dermatophilaceae bacterium]